MGTFLGPKYIPYTYMDPLGSLVLKPAVSQQRTYRRMSTDERAVVPNKVSLSEQNTRPIKEDIIYLHSGDYIVPL